MNPQLWWYVARSGGIVAWGLLAATIWVGLALSTRALGKRPAPTWLLDLHRGLGGLAVVFTAVHVVALVLDDYVDFAFVDLFVPFASDWRPGPVALGVVALYLLVAVEATSLLRRRLSTTLWRAVHVASFPLAVVATAHLLTAGTDADNPVLLGAVVATMVAAAILTFQRILLLRRRTIRRDERAARRSRPTEQPADAATVAKPRSRVSV
jgi:DMSO/TMAO reductase YedYZ heme-binding membrane subunit